MTELSIDELAQIIWDYHQLDASDLISTYSRLEKL